MFTIRVEKPEKESDQEITANRSQLLPDRRVMEDTNL
jgi:hypothetical protein